MKGALSTQQSGILWKVIIWSTFSSHKLQPQYFHISTLDMKSLSGREGMVKKKKLLLEWDVRVSYHNHHLVSSFCLMFPVWHFGKTLFRYFPSTRSSKRNLHSTVFSIRRIANGRKIDFVFAKSIYRCIHIVEDKLVEWSFIIPTHLAMWAAYWGPRPLLPLFASPLRRLSHS